jgi:hypothetical protein
MTLLLSTDNLGDLGVDGKIILKQTLWKQLIWIYECGLSSLGST